MPHWKKLIGNSKYIGAWALYGQREMILTIDRAEMQEITGKDDKEPEIKLVVYWKEDELPMICNQTNAKAISSATGSPNTDDWPGHRVILYSDRVNVGGEMKDAIRVRPEAPIAANVFCADCGQEIMSALNMTGPELAKYTLDRYKRPLCEACMMEAGRGATDKG